MRTIKFGYFLIVLGAICASFIAPAISNGKPAAAPKPMSSPFVIVLTTVRADEAAHVVRTLYPDVHLTIDEGANALVVTARPDEANAIRQVVTGIDTKNPLSRQTQAFSLHTVKAADAAARVSPLFREARFIAINARTLVVSAASPDMQQIQTLIAAIDAPPATPTPAPAVTPAATEAVRILSARPKDVARQVAGAVHGVRVVVAGDSVVLAGSPDVVQRAKDIIAVLDAPSANTPYAAVYRIKTLDAESVANLLRSSFPNARIQVDKDINALSVFATVSEQSRIASGIAQLDTAGPMSTASSNGVATAAGASNGPANIYTLKYALPGQNGSPSTSATDLATMVTQTLSSQAPDLHIIAAPSTSQLLLTGSPYSIKLARDLLQAMDVPQRLVVLDTEILEMDENTAKNLGIQFQNAAGGPFGIGSVFSEVQPTPDPNTGVSPPIKRLLPLTRTPISFGAILNLAVQHGTARVLADPRITTLSGHTATIRAGDNISIQLQAGGGPGTIATTQIQTFQTGVTLDITPIVNDNNLITVSLHPVVNSLTGILNGIPQISTRDTQTTVALQENETLVIGGLIQDNTQRTESKLPILGDLPLVGRIFRNETLNGNRNELIISVTPHIVVPGEARVYPGPPLPAIPSPQPLPTLPPGTLFPTQTPAPIPSVMLASALPSPAALPSPVSVQTPQTGFTPKPLPSASAVPTSLPVTSSTATPVPLGPTNSFTFGAPPQSNIAAPGDAARIYYVSLSPTTLTYGTAMTIAATTSTNVNSVSLSYGGVSVSIPQLSPGQWQGSIPFTLVTQPSPTGNISLSLIAQKSDGTQAMIPIPVTVIAR